MKVEITRRAFLSLSSLAAAAALYPRRAAAGAPATRVLGRTGLKVTEVGMGVMITSDPAVVRAALEAGINYFDTARSYLGGRNEAILSEGLKGRRQEVLVATKCHNYGSKAKVIRSVEESLKALKTDYIDVFQLHGLSGRDTVLLPDHLEAMAQLKKEGKIRFSGVTTHSNMAKVLDAAVEAGGYDVVLTVFNFQQPPELLEAVERTAAAGLGVVAMKVMSGGYARASVTGMSPYQSTLRWVLQQKGVAAAIPSMTTLEQVKENAAVMGTSLSWRDRAPLAFYAMATAGLYCRSCGACASQCPRGADIPAAMRALMYLEGYGQPALARETAAAASLPCGDCGSCPVRCRHGLPVGRRMAEALNLRTGGRA